MTIRRRQTKDTSQARMAPLGVAGLAIGAFAGPVLSVAIWGVNCGLALSLAAVTEWGEPWPPALGLLLYVVAAFSGGALPASTGANGWA